MLAAREAGDHGDLGDATALAGVGRFPARAKCALLPWLTLQEAIDLYRRAAGS
jgi:nitrogen fixation NifU-like protein